MESLSDWFNRFTTWVQYEPVKAAEQVRMLLVSVTVLTGTTLGEPTLAAIMGVVTAVFSLWASKKARDSVMPVERVNTEYVHNVPEQAEYDPGDGIPV